MALQIKNSSLAAELMAALKQEDQNTINQILTKLGAFDSLVAILNMAKDFNTYLLLGSLTMFKWKNTYLDFLLRVATTGTIPVGVFVGVEKKDYHNARWFVISAREAEKDLTNKLWGSSREKASKFRFYPEFTSDGLRDRICQIAQDHVGKGPQMEEQGELFSVGGMFGKSPAMGMTRPAGGATTCILVARAVWHAAGVNVILKDTTVNVPKGLFAALPQSTFGYTEFKGDLANLTVKRGDIFHIRGDNFKNGNDSTHVGIMTSPAGNVWSTVEGGAGDHITKTNHRKIVKITSGKWAGKYTFENDINITDAGARPIVGWYSLDKIDTSRIMTSSDTAETK